jgi:hypothetical protein
MAVGAEKSAATPFVFQCTWCERQNQARRFSLGASLEGYRWDPAQTGTWKNVLQRARFNLVNGEVLKLRGWSVNKSPRIQRKSTGTKFGNCAETYPFLALLRLVLLSFFLIIQEYTNAKP